MSFVGYKDVIEEGDLVFCWISRSLVKPLRVKSSETLNTRYGSFPHASMIGQRYGSQIPSKSGLGFIYLLHPSPELWTTSLPHRTQIVYTPDSSFISQKLNILPGSRVIEAGTGSGSFTHSLYRTISTAGKLFTYEFHELRYQQASKEFKDHKLDNLTLTHRDVCRNGFDIEGQEINCDAIFLDLPAPWDAIPHLERVLNRDIKVSICCFSPCIEQVTKTIEELKKNNWTSIQMVEINHQRWESHKVMVKRINDVVARLKDIQTRKREGLEALKAERKQRAEERLKEEVEEPTEDSEITEDEPERKYKKIKRPRSQRKEGYNPFGKGKNISIGDPSYEWKIVGKEETELKSHTSFLTFAVKLPEFTKLH